MLRRYQQITLFLGLICCLSMTVNTTYGQRGGRGRGGFGRGGSSGGGSRMAEWILKGKDSIKVSELDPRWKRMLDGFGLGGKDVITRKDLEEAGEKMRSRFGMGGGRDRGSSGRGGPPSSGSSAEDQKKRAASAAESWFKRLDKNGDGLLNNDEMQQSEIRYEKDKYDTNKDGSIDLKEYSGYMQKRLEKRDSERRDRSRSSGGDRKGDDNKSEEKKKEDLYAELDKKPTVYRATNLPDNIPGWFKEYDVNTDGQVSLFEWKEKERSIGDFQKYDRNDDGLLTPSEVVYAVEVVKVVDSDKNAGSSRGSSRFGGGTSRGGSSRFGGGSSRGGSSRFGGGTSRGGSSRFGGSRGGFPGGGSSRWGGSGRRGR